jgi:hypothetical protein
MKQNPYGDIFFLKIETAEPKYSSDATLKSLNVTMARTAYAPSSVNLLSKAVTLSDQYWECNDPRPQLM